MNTTVTGHMMNIGLQELEVWPLGANKSKKINVRLLAATAKNLTKEAEQGRFRQDLLFRINVIELKIPPLRERLNDIPLLVDSFLAKESVRMNIKVKGVAPGALALLCRYSWPGNVRELKNVLEHAMIFADHGWVTMKNLPQHFLESQHNLSGNIVPEGFSIKKGKMFLEKRLIEKALSRTDGNKTQAAELLEISYPALLLTQVNGN